ncbi:MAG: hypothetical protein KDE25_13515 [Novosphingobium sp.]|nr:hypothetical protein [Novosphingobium sp.]
MNECAQVSVALNLDTSLHQWMTRGGDARIVLDPATGLNRYSSAPFPRDVLAFASSTANDLGEDADKWLRARFPQGAAHLEDGGAYAECLNELRGTIRAAYGLDSDIDVFFAPSGTDLEYIGLLAVDGRRQGGVVNHLLGADEVGSGCIFSAAGAYFAQETALGMAVMPGEPVAGLGPVTMADTPVRCEAGEAFESRMLATDFASSIQETLATDRYPLVHVVHGSKTGLVLPNLDDVDALKFRFGEDVCFVVDACQARITSEAIRAYLSRGMIVFVTGSKFMGGPPFSGFALLPPGIVSGAAPLARGMAQIFRRAEVPVGWAGREICKDTGNPGLALRLSASLFELARFQALPIERVARVVRAFTLATDRLASLLDVRKVASVPLADADEASGYTIEMLTLVTLDLCHATDGALIRLLALEDAGRIHAALIAEGIRLGQPVRCVRLAGDRWGATLRIGLSMPQIVMLDALDDTALAQWFEIRSGRIGEALHSHLAA